MVRGDSPLQLFPPDSTPPPSRTRSGISVSANFHKKNIPASWVGWCQEHRIVPAFKFSLRRVISRGGGVFPGGYLVEPKMTLAYWWKCLIRSSNNITEETLKCHGRRLKLVFCARPGIQPRSSLQPMFLLYKKNCILPSRQHSIR